MLTSRNVAGVQFRKIGESGNRINLVFRGAQQNNFHVSNFVLYGSSGDQLVSDTEQSFIYVDFPFKGNVRYEATNNMTGITVECYFEFEILEEGSWNIVVENH